MIKNYYIVNDRTAKRSIITNGNDEILKIIKDFNQNIWIPYIMKQRSIIAKERRMNRRQWNMN